jgi:hypothetical protein
MAKTPLVKDRYIGARVDPVFGGEVNNYLAQLDDTTMGDLIRKAMKEYMLNHPLKGAPTVDPSIKALGGGK